jgi:CheY-like chemotaxis protein
MDATPVTTINDAVRILSHPALQARSDSCPVGPHSLTSTPNSVRGFDAVIFQWHAGDDSGEQAPFHLANAVRGRPGIPVLAICAVYQRENVQKHCGESKPFRSLVTQPVQLRRLRIALEQMLDPDKHEATHIAERIQNQFASRSAPTALAVPVQLAFPDLAPKRLRVLAADDSIVNRRVLALLLGRLGAEFTLVCDGQEAVERASAELYDVILLDMHMPRMTGDEAAAAIRATMDPEAVLPAIIAVSGDADGENQHASVFDAFLVKPVLLSTLRATLRKILPELVGFR